jgi:hypothetical protein
MINTLELESMMRALGMAPTQQEVAEMINEIDTDGIPRPRAYIKPTTYTCSLIHCICFLLCNPKYFCL